MSTYVLVHGAWHTGRELAPVAALIKAAGHEVFTPTIKGNGAGDAKTVGLAEAIESIADSVLENDLEDVVLAGHSYGGMVITGVADELPDRIRRLVYWNAFVPNSGESLVDMVPPELARLSSPWRPNDATVRSSFRSRSGAKRLSTTPTSTRRSAHIVR